MENHNVQKPKLAFNQALIVIFLVIGSIAVAAVTFDYAGNIQLKFGADGLQFQINGAEKPM